MKGFTYLEAASAKEAVDILEELKGQAKILAGGIDLLYLMKKGVGPKYLVDIKGIKEMSSIMVDGDVLRIGALATLSDIASSSDVRRELSMLSDAASRVASPQIRNVATVGGNLLQNVWCWYLRNGYPCWRNEGRGCPAASGENSTYFSIFGGRFCVAAQPSDLAPVLVACDASAMIVGPKGTRAQHLQSLLSGSAAEDGKGPPPTFASNELLYEIEVPRLKKGTRTAFCKASVRESWDFALASVSVAACFEGGVVTDARIVLGGVSTYPYRAVEAEEAIIGKQLGKETIKSASRLGVVKAKPLQMNSYKVMLTEGLIYKALTSIADDQATGRS
ncbi:MAG: FAD binding domain-containing protein [Thaumarchaeota archaeon]|nr:FAD binding domain-containing protein [Nitrososphaerota archaeon]